jgi:hypothetical protein
MSRPDCDMGLGAFSIVCGMSLGPDEELGDKGFERGIDSCAGCSIQCNTDSVAPGFGQ